MKIALVILIVTAVVMFELVGECESTSISKRSPFRGGNQFNTDIGNTGGSHTTTNNAGPGRERRFNINGPGRERRFNINGPGRERREQVNQDMGKVKGGKSEPKNPTTAHKKIQSKVQARKGRKG